MAGIRADHRGFPFPRQRRFVVAQGVRTMADFKFDYPAVLTKAGWDKNKGVIAKLVKSNTDVGAKLVELETAYKTSGFATIKAFNGLDPIGFKEYSDGLAKGLTAGIAALNNKLGPVKIVAKAAWDDFSKSKVIPKSSSDYVKSVLDACDPFKQALTNFIPLVQTKLKSEYRGRLHKDSAYVATVASGASASNGLVQKIVGMVKKVEAKPTVVQLHAEFGSDGPHRMLTTIFKTWDQLTATRFPKLAATIYTGKAMTEFFTLPGLQDMGNENMSVASKKLETVVKTGKNERTVVTTFLLSYSNSVIKADAMLKHMQTITKALKAV
jgi:hypothetical protein